MTALRTCEKCFNNYQDNGTNLCNQCTQPEQEGWEERFKKLLWKYEDGYTQDFNALIKFIRTEIAKAKQEVAQECYLQCLAVHCGDNECSEAIKSKYKLNS